MIHESSKQTAAPRREFALLTRLGPPQCQSGFRDQAGISASSNKRSESSAWMTSIKHEAGWRARCNQHHPRRGTTSGFPAFLRVTNPSRKIGDEHEEEHFTRGDRSIGA